MQFRQNNGRGSGGGRLQRLQTSAARGSEEWRGARRRRISVRRSSLYSGRTCKVEVEKAPRWAAVIKLSSSAI